MMIVFAGVSFSEMQTLPLQYFQSVSLGIRLCELERVTCQLGLQVYISIIQGRAIDFFK